MSQQRHKMTNQQNTIDDMKYWPERQASVSSSPFHFPLRNGVPTEIKFPVEAAPSHVRPGDVLEWLVADDVDYWTNHRRSFTETIFSLIHSFHS